jgi:hypothetical protein
LARLFLDWSVMTETDHDRQAREEMARRAAMAMFRAPGLDVDAALSAARRGRGPPPGRGLIYRHLEALLLEALGLEAFEASRRERLVTIVEVLDLIDFLASPDAIDVAGRTARGYLEGPVLVFARVYEGASLVSLAGELEANGVEEVGCITAHTRHGPLPRINFESDGLRFTVTRCPRSLHRERDRSLFSGEPVAVVSLDELRSKVDPGFSPGHP